MYSFVRNEDYYKEVSEYLLSQMNDNQLNKIIISRNVSLFSKILENCNHNDKHEFFIKRKDNIIKFLNETDWK